jgi:hypothetical protein
LTDEGQTRQDERCGQQHRHARRNEPAMGTDRPGSVHVRVEHSGSETRDLPKDQPTESSRCRFYSASSSGDTRQNQPNCSGLSAVWPILLIPSARLVRPAGPFQQYGLCAGRLARRLIRQATSAAIAALSRCTAFPRSRHPEDICSC